MQTAAQNGRDASPSSRAGIAHWRLLLAIYAAAHLPLFAFTDARFWDDWSLFDGNPDAVRSIFTQAGLPLVGDFHLAMVGGGWWLYPALSFICFALVSICLHKVLIDAGASRASAFWIAAFSAVLPVNFARVAAINASSALLFLAFMLAWCALTSGSGRWRLAGRVASLAGFAFSFQLGSLLVLYAMPVTCYALIQWREQGFPFSLRSLGRTIIRMPDLLALPVVFWIIRGVYMKPSGLFADYNAPRVGLEVISRTLLPIWQFIAGDWLVMSIGALLLIACLLACFAAPLRKQAGAGIGISGNGLVYIALGLLACCLASFPYAAVGKMPSYEEWTATRFQITLQIGLPILLYGVVRAFASLRKDAFPAAYLPALLLCVFVANWWQVYALFYVDHLKQASLVSIMRTNPVLQGKNVIFLDRSGLTAFNTYAGLAEYASLRVLAGSNRDVLTLDYSSLGGYSGWGPFVERTRKYLNVWSKTERAQPDNPPLLYIINRGREVNNHVLLSMRMVAFHYLKPAREQEELRTFVRLDGPYTYAGTKPGAPE